MDFRRKDRVLVTDQHSEFRNLLGTVQGAKDGLILVKIDGSARTSSQKLPRFKPSALRHTVAIDPLVPFVQPVRDEEE